jgi:hypothetical protein
VETSETAAPTRRARHWWWIAAALLVVGLLYGRALLEARGALDAGDRLAATAPDEAIVAWRHAVEWYAPLNPYCGEAVERLAALALGPIDSPEARDRSLLAAESLRTGILVTRTLYTPFAAQLDPIEARIAELRGAEAAARTGQPLEAEVARQRGLLRASRERAPSPGWSLVTTLAFVGWIAVTWRGVRRSFDAEGRVQRRAVLAYGGASAVALATWIVGLTLV